jgi:hypothetical protein
MLQPTEFSLSYNFVTEIKWNNIVSVSYATGKKALWRLPDVRFYVSGEETGRWKILTWMVAGSITFLFRNMQIRTKHIHLCRVNVMAANFNIGLIYCAIGEVVKMTHTVSVIRILYYWLWRFDIICHANVQATVQDYCFAVCVFMKFNLKIFLNN